MEAEIIYKFILSFVLILIAARIGGDVAERFLKQPAVLGELAAGIIISPFALGGLINDPIVLNFGTIHAFGLEEFSPFAIISEIAVIVLLFTAGVETDVKSFLRHGATGSVVALGGVLLPFAMGFVAIMLLAPEAGNVGWLFIGATLTATSIGVTVRILMEMGRLQTKEGTTILVGAVVDDIIGIVILSVVNTIATTGSFDTLSVVRILVVGFAVWAALLLVGAYLYDYISRFILAPFRKSGSVPIVALLVGILIAYLVTLVDLHPVVGAYAGGLLFAATREREEIIEKTHPIMLFLAPFFFAFLGMQVNIPLLWGGGTGALIALALIVLAVAGKVIGCYIPARVIGKFDHNSSMIVGVGMVPRGEVGLIIASVGYGSGAISQELFGIAVAISLITTLITPAMLKPLFKREKTQA